MARDDVDAWIEEVRAMGVRSVLCLLDDRQLARYSTLPGGLLAYIRQAGLEVGHVPVPDLQSPPLSPQDLETITRVFEGLAKPVLVHCWAGIDRTGAAVAHLVRKMET
jgi:protein-tyrosine phosphatase